MKKLTIVAVAVAVTALVFAVVGFPATSSPLPPDNGAAGPTFGRGTTSQVRPTEMRVRIENSHLEIEPIVGFIEVFNAQPHDSTFGIRFVDGVDPWPGFSPPPAQARSWVIFEEPVITIPARSFGKFTVILVIPAGAVSGRWEFWTEVREMGAGNVEGTVATRWLVEMN